MPVIRSRFHKLSGHPTYINSVISEAARSRKKKEPVPEPVPEPEPEAPHQKKLYDPAILTKEIKTNIQNKSNLIR
jgi:hypothetical protein